MKIKQKNTIDMTHGTLWNKLLIQLSQQIFPNKS